MNWSSLIRQTHRWVSMAFTLLVLGIFAAMGLGHDPAPLVYLAPLIPLALLVLSGLYMFVLPYARKWRRASDGP